MPIGDRHSNIHDDLRWGFRPLTNENPTQLFPGFNGSDSDGWYVSSDFNSDTTYTGSCYEPNEQDCQTYHPGEDWNGNGGGNTDVGQAVYAIATGRVLFAGWAMGSTVIIAHRLPDDDDDYNNDELVASVYGHLQSVANLKVNDPVYPITKIGEIGTSLTDPEGAHLHWEIRKSSMLSEDEYLNVSLKEPAEYWPDTDTRFIGDNYYDPTDFIKEHDLVGKYKDGWHADGTSRAILERFLRAKESGNPLGQPHKGLFGLFVNVYKGVTFQDFRGDNTGFMHGNTAITVDPRSNKSAYLIREKICDWYMTVEEPSEDMPELKGPTKLGAARGDEYRVDKLIRQDFEIKGRYLEYYDSDPNDKIPGFVTAKNPDGSVFESTLSANKAILCEFSNPGPTKNRTWADTEFLVMATMVVVMLPYLLPLR